MQPASRDLTSSIVASHWQAVLILLCMGSQTAPYAHKPITKFSKMDSEASHRVTVAVSNMTSAI